MESKAIPGEGRGGLAARVSTHGRGLHIRGYPTDSMARTAVTFDLDETLAVVRGDRSEILAAAGREVGASNLTREAYLRAHRRHHASRTRRELFAHLLTETDQPDVDPAALAEAYRDRIGDALVPVPGVDPFLEELAAERPVGLVTNGPVRAQRDKLDRLGWTDRFDAVVISGELGHAKPGVEPFLAACRRLGVEPEATLHVGDRFREDVTGARNAGLAAVLVTDGSDAPDAAVPTIDRDRIVDELPRHVAAVRPV